MRSKTIIMIMFLTFSFNYAYADENFRNDRYRGWHWFEENKKIIEDNKEDNNNLTAKEEAQIIIAKLEEAKYESMLRPTHENIEKYMRLQKVLIDMAANYSSVWQEVLLLRPDLDAQASNPTANYASKSKAIIKDQETKNKILELKERFALVFIYKASCPYSVEFAPVIKNFAQMFDWTIGSVTLDNETLPEFPDAKKGMNSIDNSMVVPAVLVIDSKTKEIFPLSVGAIAISDLINRSMILYNIVQKTESNK